MSKKEQNRKAPAPGSRARRSKVVKFPKGHGETTELARENKALRSRIALLERQVQRLNTLRSNRGAAANTFADGAHEKKLTDAIVNSLPGIFYTLDFSGRFIRWNANFEHVTGYSGEEIAAMNALDLFADDDRERIAAGIQKVAQTGAATVEAEILLKSGHAIPHLFTGCQIEFDGKPSLIGMGIDLSERKRAEEELRKYRDHLEDLVAERTAELQSSKHLLDETGRLARVGGWEINLEKNELNWTDVVRQIHEIGPDYRPELESAINFYAPEAVPVISEAVRLAIEVGEPFDVELQLITAKKKRLWVRAVGEAVREEGKIVKVRGVFQDIQVRRQAEDELKKHRDHLEELVNERTEELKENQEALIEAQAVARLGSWEWDAVKDEITASAEFYRLFTVVPEQIVRFTQFIERLHPDDRERVQRDVEAAMKQDRPYDTDYRVKLRDGNWRDINARGRVIVDEDGKPVRMVGTCLDITARKLVEDNLRTSEARYRTVVNNIPQKVFVKGRDFKWKSINELFARDLGKRPDEIVGKFDHDLFPKDLADKYHADDKRIMETGATDEFDEEYVDKGERRIVHTIKTPVRDEGGAISGVLGVFWDVTAEKRIQETLRRNSQELAIRNAIAEVFLSVAEKEMFSRVLEIILSAFKSKFGVFGYIDELGSLVVPTMTRNVWDQCQVVEKTIIFPKEKWGNSIWPTSIRKKEILYSNERSKLIPAGHIAIERNISAPIIHQGKVVGLFQVANKETDYDEVDLALARVIANTIAPILDARLGQEREQLRRSRAEENLQREAEALARSNQELEQFAYVASHDLQEPLRMVSSYTQLLAQRYQDKLDQDARDFIAYAVDGANRMQQLIQDLLEYSRVTTRAKPPERFDAHEALGEAVKNLQAAIHETGALISNDGLPLLKGDRIQIAQVFQNLIGNSIKFHKPDEPPRVHLSAERIAEHPESWTFKVRDNGIGIEPRHFERLFVIFQRLHGKQEYPGNGIGLALCKRIIERHGGRIWVESEPGKGTNFFFTLPVDGQDSKGEQ